LEILRGERIDVMLVDRLLPDMSGVDLVSEAAELAHDTAVILMSRANSGTDAAAAMKSGARDYLLKRDLNAETLHAAIVEAVRSTRLEDQTNRQTRKLRQSSQRVGRLVQQAGVRIDASFEQAETALEEMRQTPANPLRDLAAHFHRVEHSLRESRQFLAELTRLCDRAGWAKE
jgi:DNA-binding NtrC family response regulator